jgi:mono/diheme cytochrome c family protein
MKYFAIALLVMGVSCSGPVKESGPVKDTSDQGGAEAVQTGAELYQTHCVACHGRALDGNGALAASLPLHPASLTTLSFANGGSFPTARVMEEIYGYPGKFHRGLMPEFGALLEGEKHPWKAPDGQVIMTPKPLLDLVAYLETQQQ